MAETLTGLVPGDDRNSYPRAFEVVSDIQLALIDSRYTAWARWLKLFLMLLVGGGILNMLYGIFAVAQTVVDRLGATY